MIKDHGPIPIPSSLIAYAGTIKHENYKVNIPTKFSINAFNNEDSKEFIRELSGIVNIPEEKLDYVFFSVCPGAEPHTDALDPAKFTGTTFVVPIILPTGDSIIVADNVTSAVAPGHIYEFDHTKTHQMDLEDTESGCVVIMVAVLH